MIEHLQAFRREDGQYVLTGSTYSLRGKIKQLGGKYDGRQWSVPESALSELQAQKQFLAFCDAWCHHPADEPMVISERDVERGYTVRDFCSRCDSQYSRNSQIKIVHVLHQLWVGYAIDSASDNVDSAQLALEPNG